MYFRAYKLPCPSAEPSAPSCGEQQGPKCPGLRRLCGTGCPARHPSLNTDCAWRVVPSHCLANNKLWLPTCPALCHRIQRALSWLGQPLALDPAQLCRT